VVPAIGDGAVLGRLTGSSAGSVVVSRKNRAGAEVASGAQVDLGGNKPEGVSSWVFLEGPCCRHGTPREEQYPSLACWEPLGPAESLQFNHPADTRAKARNCYRPGLSGPEGEIGQGA
jgi:hypothetical protein